LICDIINLLLGIPWAMNELPFSNKPTMIVGVDMYRDSKKDISIMGFTATWDRHFSNYTSMAVLNGKKSDLCNHLKEAMINALKEFSLKNK